MMTPNLRPSPGIRACHCASVNPLANAISALAPCSRRSASTLAWFARVEVTAESCETTLDIDLSFRHSPAPNGPASFVKQLALDGAPLPESAIGFPSKPRQYRRQVLDIFQRRVKVDDAGSQHEAVVDHRVGQERIAGLFHGREQL